jgi:hypothetical protein
MFLLELNPASLISGVFQNIHDSYEELNSHHPNHPFSKPNAPVSGESHVAKIAFFLSCRLYLSPYLFIQFLLAYFFASALEIIIKKINNKTLNDHTVTGKKY